MQLLTPAEILTLLAIGVCLLAGVWAVLSSLGRGRAAIGRGAREAAAHGQVACGACGHAVELQTTTCPECGTPHAVAGTATPALLVRTGAPAWLTAILLAVPVFATAFILFGVASRAVPTVVAPAPPASTRRAASIDLAPNRHPGAQPPYALTLAVVVHGRERRTGRPPDERVWFEPASGEGFLWIRQGGAHVAALVHDFAADQWRVEDNPGPGSTVVATGSGLDAGVAALYAHAGLDQRRWAAAEMHEAVQYFTYRHGGARPNGFVAVGPASRSTSEYDTALSPSGRRSESIRSGPQVLSTPRPSPWAMPLGLAAGGVPILAWIVGLALLARSRRRVMRGCS